MYCWRNAAGRHLTWHACWQQQQRMAAASLLLQLLLLLLQLGCRRLPLLLASPAYKQCKSR
jgi:hypothetical protein